MNGFGSTSPGRRAISWVRLALQIGQGAIVAMAVLVFGVELPLIPVASIFVLVALFNLLLFNGERIDRRLSENELLLSLTADVAQLSALLIMAGGLANPFALFLLAPVIVGSALLSRRGVVILGVLSTAAIVILSAFHWPLRFSDGTEFEPSPGLQFGILTAYLAALIALTLMIRRLSEDAVSRADALARTEKALEEQQRVSAIGAMAAAIAHELGTPLATIKLTAAELRRDLRDNPEAMEDAALIVQQAERCRDSLSALEQLRSPEKEHIRTGPIIAVLQEAAGPHEGRRAEIRYRLNGAPAGRDAPPLTQPEIPRRPELIHGLRNLIQNAVDFATSRVWVDVTVKSDQIAIAIGDDGEGFSTEIMERLGEPFATTRGRDGDPKGDYKGMGLGVFIAISLLERTGAELSFRNTPHAIDRLRSRQRGAPPPNRPSIDAPSGAVVTVTWPVAALATPKRRRSASPAERKAAE